MTLLAFDTSSRRLSVALLAGPAAAWRESESGDSPSEMLIVTIDGLCRKHKIKPADIHFVAVGLGPGSFTGLRVGVMTAKMLAVTLGAKVVGISSLAALAHASGLKGRVAVMRDARKGMVYGASYDIGEKFKEIIKPGLFSREDFLKQVGSVEWVPEDTFPSAASIGKIALDLIRNKKFIPPEKLEPLYLHPRDCNVTRGLTPLGKQR
ncbi:MAG: tRNA (adenosine(37)-N6)-threonylcarbamoyltransferase complex dimerization subunit type 1 TsaB [Candidatus Omnitrophica bacterium]|nr:tRNA (adenosine(37)-N6)-threonylcarbamoyltransferase complex dimerization subunit type 1 TsaB [Candidatus Omnitrophota bacterium]